MQANIFERKKPRNLLCVSAFYISYLLNLNFFFHIYFWFLLQIIFQIFKTNQSNFMTILKIILI